MINRTDKVLIATLAAIIATLLFLLMTAGSRLETRIEEDDPRWDCATMGNRICGDSSI
ncbi:MAG: hypothetical protein LC687_00040 [Actinobacteria bacterium]|nr:hypothetical protein [Actinomycetota bacterium]